MCLNMHGNWLMIFFSALLKCCQGVQNGITELSDGTLAFSLQEVQSNRSLNEARNSWRHGESTVQIGMYCNKQDKCMSLFKVISIFNLEIDLLFAKEKSANVKHLFAHYLPNYQPVNKKMKKVRFVQMSKNRRNNILSTVYFKLKLLIKK